jgi:hypothetical protein
MTSFGKTVLRLFLPLIVGTAVLSACGTDDPVSPEALTDSPGASQNSTFDPVLLDDLQPSPTEPQLFGPEVVTRQRGVPEVQRFDLSTEGFQPPFILHIRSGDEEGNHRVTAGRVHLNGQEIMGPSDFKKRFAGVDLEAELPEGSQLEVLLQSTPGNYLTLWISGEPVDPSLLFCPGESTAYQTLQEAIADVEPEGTIRVCDGEWPIGDVQIGKALTLTAENPGQATLVATEGAAGLAIDGVSEGVVVVQDLALVLDGSTNLVTAGLEVPQLVLQRLSMRNADATPGFGGAGVLSTTTGSVVMTSVDLQGFTRGLFGRGFTREGQGTYELDDVRCSDVEGVGEGVRICFQFALNRLATLNNTDCDLTEPNAGCVFASFGPVVIRDSDFSCRVQADVLYRGGSCAATVNGGSLEVENSSFTCTEAPGEYPLRSGACLQGRGTAEQTLSMAGSSVRWIWDGDPVAFGGMEFRGYGENTVVGSTFLSNSVELQPDKAGVAIVENNVFDTGLPPGSGMGQFGIIVGAGADMGENLRIQRNDFLSEASGDILNFTSSTVPGHAACNYYGDGAARWQYASGFLFEFGSLEETYQPVSITPIAGRPEVQCGN